jgi:HEPN domain-containing protein
VTCPYCEYAAKFHSYQKRPVLTVHGLLEVLRAYYYCGRCKQSFIPYDDVLGLVDQISPGLMPLICLAGTLLPFEDAAKDVLKRFAGVQVSASTVLRCTEGAGERLRAQQKEGRMVQPTQAEPKWTGPRQDGQPRAYVGLDAFSVPMQGIGASKAEHRMLYTALLYTPNKEHTRYLVDFELETLAEQVRSQARALGVTEVSDLIAVTDGGNGLEEALQRHLAEHLITILDWYHAAEHICDFAKVWHASAEEARQQWQQAAKGILYEQGGEALLAHLRTIALPAKAAAEVHEELRKLIGFFENNRHRTDYPTYRRNGWDIGSGPTEAGCKIIGERLKGSGMRWVEDGAATVAALRALYVSGSKVWDGFWAQPHRPAA